MKKFVMILTGACALTLLTATAARAQTDPPRFEVGAQFSLLNFDTLDNFGERRLALLINGDER